MMKRIVITGSTRGIGFGLADAFLGRGCAVTVSGRTQASVDTAVQRLAAMHGEEKVAGQPCDVTELDQVQALWAAAVNQFGRVDIWINNAGIGHAMQPLWELSPEQVEAVMETNVLGTTHGVRVAFQGMKAQGGGQIYNLEGFGSTGRTRPGMSVYGTSKAAITYLTKALTEELEGTPVKLGSISPGMVITNLITDRFEENPETETQARGIFNILADRVEDVTPWLADQILANEAHGKRIAWLTRPRILWRFLTAPFSKRNVFEP
jgi:NAD(P)-dependent dehydrogenase (short-subunit alcohol dehydrogenase family)